MTVASKTAGLTKAINDTVKELQVTQASLDGQVTIAEAYATTAATHQATAEGYRDTTATHAATVATGLATVDTNVTYSGIAAIAASKAETAVDVFVYDTSLDSDGGAWRKRCQHTSWYNETLNTATRGSRREFPSVAVIVAETDRVTIYDGDDPALPMWMVFNGYVGWNRIITYGDSGRISSVAMLNGILTVTTNGATNNTSVNGPFAVSFVDDSAHKFNTVHGHRVWPQDIARRNSSVAPGWLNVVAIGSGVVDIQSNDVAMTVLPDAPIDPATGLPVPTIAVATAGGVSVIKDDGTVVNRGTANNQRRIEFLDDDRFWVNGVLGSQWADWIGRISTSATFGLTWGNYPKLRNASYSSASPRVLEQNAQLAVASNRSTGRLTRIHDEWEGFSDALWCEHASDHITGWMPGDIKSALLSNTDASSLVGEDYGIQTLTVADLAIDATVTVSDLGDRFRITKNATDGLWGTVRADAAVGALTVGATYFAEFEVLDTGPSNNAYTGATHGGGTSFIGNAYTTGNTVRNAFANATGAGTGGVRFNFSVSRGSNPASSEAGDWIEISKTVTVRRADADRSPSFKGLIAAGGSGIISREPVATGAELVGYYGFRSVSGSERYFYQPYNPSLDFGTGDFSIMFWVKDPGGSSTSAVLQRRGVGGSDTGLYVWRITSTGTRNLVFNVGSDGLNANQATPVNTYTHVTMLRRNGKLRVYLDAELTAESSGISTYNVVSDQPLYFGVASNISQANEGWRFALLRISATAPTADQIKKIYADERKLFQPGAQCTLYGTSDAVTALAHDPKTNLLHVGTSAGRSTFDGLVRVDNTTNPVGTAISAVNGLIVEE